MRNPTRESLTKRPSGKAITPPVIGLASHIWLVEEAMELNDEFGVFAPIGEETEFGVIAVCNDLSTARPLAEESALGGEFTTFEWRDTSLWVRVEGEWFEHIRCRLVAVDKFLPELQGVAR